MKSKMIGQMAWVMALAATACSHSAAQPTQMAVSSPQPSASIAPAKNEKAASITGPPLAAGPAIEVLGFTAEEKHTLPDAIKNRVWTVVRSSQYDGERSVRLFIVLPNSSQAWTSVIREKFQGFAEWARIAEEDNAVLVFPDPGEDLRWNEADLGFLEALYDSCSRYKLEGASRFIAGYGDGGGPVSLMALKHPDWFAGAAFVEGDVVDVNAAGVAKKKLPMAILMINTPGSFLAPFINHFKASNGVDRTEKVDENDVIHFKSGSAPWNHDFAKSHFIREKRHLLTRIPTYIYDHLFRAVGRWKTITGEDTLRGRVRAGDVPGFEKITDDKALGRTAFVYVPSAIKNRKIFGPIPLVMLFHGRRCDGEYFLDQSDWYRTAERYNFIVYAPNGLLADWRIDRPDYPFVLNRIQQFASKGITIGADTYAIDATRIYAHGFSNGSFFVSELAMKKPELFAAVAMWAGGTAPSQVTEKKALPLPVWYGIGTTDNYFAAWEADFEEMLDYFIATSGGDRKRKTTLFYDALGLKNLIKTDVYGNGTIEVRDSRAPNIRHGVINEMANYIWEDFFSLYKKQGTQSVRISHIKTP